MNQFRQDPITGEWVLIATSRAKGHFKSGGGQMNKLIEGCPFEDPQKSGNEEPMLIINRGEVVEYKAGIDWTTQVLVNKNPALTPGLCGPMSKYGPFNTYEAHGFHELVITKDHDKSFHNFTTQETVEVLEAYKIRYNEIARDDCGDYIQIIHNHGLGAGATIYHNHSQIFSLPVLPTEVRKSMRGADEYFKNHGKKIYNEIIDWEKSEAKRIIVENERFIALCPFVSKEAYEIKIFPKFDSSSFGDILESDLPQLAEMINIVMAKLAKALDNPDYNIVIHTAPVTKENGVNYDYYKWHVEILPRMTKVGALELGISVYVNVIDPDDAAKLLRETQI